MPERIGIAIGLAITHFTSFAWGTFEGALRNVARGPLQKVLGAAVRRFKEGQVPSEDQLSNAFRRSLGRAARVLAYHLYGPKRGPMRDLLENASDWPTFFQRFAEAAQNNIVAGTPRDHWIAALIDRSKDPKDFADFSLGVIVDERQMARALWGESDAEFCEHVHKQFLEWVEHQVPDNGHKPADFEEKVRNGCGNGKGNHHRLTFYELVRLFFREELTEQPGVFRLFSLNVITALKHDIEGIKRAIPDADTLERFTEVLRTFEEKEFDANYSRFKNWVRRQNEKLYEFFRAEFAELHEHLDRQDHNLAEVKTITTEHKYESKAAFAHLLRFMKLGVLGIVVLVIGIFAHQQYMIGALRARVTAAEKRDMPGSELLAEFQRRLPKSFSGASSSESGDSISLVLANLARDRGITVDELHQRMRQAASGGPERVVLAKQLRKASEADGVRSRRIERDAIRDMAAEAMAGKRFAQALIGYQDALNLTMDADEPLEWAGLQTSLGLAHWQVGARAPGASVNLHAKALVAAFRNALGIYRDRNLYHALAKAQNNLAIALTHQASMSDLAEGASLLSEAVELHAKALKFFKRDEFEEDWASTHLRLGIALRTQARQTNGTEAIRLLQESLPAFTNALDVWSFSKSPLDWGAVKNNLGNSLFDLARRGHPADMDRMLGQAFDQFREVLDKIPRKDDEIQWAMTQANLGNVLCVQAMQTNGPISQQLFENAAAACKKATNVFLAQSMKQNWAMTTHALGNVYRYQALRVERLQATPLLRKAIEAYDSALTVFTPEFSRHAQNSCSQDRLITNMLLQISQDSGSKWPPDATAPLRGRVNIPIQIK